MKKLIYIISIFIFSQTLLAQQNNTMYFMQTLNQTQWLNPAVQNDCKLTIGGALVPITGQLFLPIQYNYGNNGFAVNDMIQWNGDSLVRPGFKGFDTEHLYDRLREVNYITQEFHINLLTVGYRYNDDWYFGLAINDKIETRFSFNEDIMRFALEGNGQTFLNETAHLGDLGITATMYSEYALTASKKINKKLTVGLTAKALFGKMNIWTEKSVIDLTTNNSENYPITVDADVAIHTSNPFTETTQLYYGTDSMTIESKDKDIDPKSAYFNYKNFGMGMDLGAIYKLDDKIELYVSLTDFGYIKWKDNAQTFTVKGEYYWEGYNFQPALTEDQELIADYNDSLAQDIVETFEPKLEKESYTSYLTPKVYLGGTYQLNEKIRGGLLLRGAFFQHAMHPSLTLSGNFKINTWLETTASYSMINNTYSNIGVGFVARAKWFQFFMMSDNVWGFIWPQATQNINFRMGINLVFGCKKEENSTRL